MPTESEIPKTHYWPGIAWQEDGYDWRHMLHVLSYGLTMRLRRTTDILAMLDGREPWPLRAFGALLRAMGWIGEFALADRRCKGCGSAVRLEPARIIYRCMVCGHRQTDWYYRAEEFDALYMAQPTPSWRDEETLSLRVGGVRSIRIARPWDEADLKAMRADSGGVRGRRAEYMIYDDMVGGSDADDVGM